MSRFDRIYDGLPEHMRDGARRYVENGIEPGGFLMAVLSNDLLNAFKAADHINTQNMRAWAQFLYDAPLGSYGSAEQVRAWIAAGGLAGIEAASAKATP